MSTVDRESPSAGHASLRLVLRSPLGLVAIVVALSALLYLPAGCWDWPEAWALVIGYSVLSVPALGSAWGLIPGATIGLLFVLRTSLEDQMLRQELASNAEYAQRVRHRLVPGVW